MWSVTKNLEAIRQKENCSKNTVKLQKSIHTLWFYIFIWYLCSKKAAHNHDGFMGEYKMLVAQTHKLIKQNARKIVQLLPTKTNTLIRNEHKTKTTIIENQSIKSKFCLVLKPGTNSNRYKNEIWWALLKELLSWAFIVGKNWPYLSNGFGQTFFSSISLLAALFFSAVSVLLVWARDTGNVAILSPLSTSTVDIFESGPPITINYFSLSFSQTAFFKIRSITHSVNTFLWFKIVLCGV